MNRRRFARIGGSLLAVVVLLVASKRLTPSNLRLAPVTREDLVLSVEVTGVLSAVSTISIGPPQISGWWDYKITFLAPEGSKVAAGAPVLGFDTSGLENRRRVVEAERDEVKQTLEKRKAELELQAVDERLALADAESSLRRAELVAGTPTDLMSGKERRRAEIDLALAKQRVAESSRRLAELTAAGDAERGILENRLRRADGEVARIVADIASMSVKAPRGGTVVHIANWRGEKRKIGDTVWNAERLLEIPDLDAMRAEGEIDEAESGAVAAGQKVTLRLDAHPDLPLTGTIEKVRRAVQRRTADDPSRVVRVDILLATTDPAKMRPGMRFTGGVETGRVASALVVPIAAVEPRADRTVVRLRRFGRTVERAVVLGPRSREKVQLLEGLSEGDRVVVGTKSAEEEEK